MYGATLIVFAWSFFQGDKWKFVFFIPCYWLSPGHNLTVAQRTGHFFFQLFQILLLEFLSKTYKNPFWWFVGKNVFVKKKFGLFPYISIYKGISKEMVPKHCFWIAKLNSNFNFNWVEFSFIFIRHEKVKFDLICWFLIA